MSQPTARLIAAALSLLLLSPAARAQSADVEAKAAIADVDSVLVALSSGDNATLKRVILDSAIVGSVRRHASRIAPLSWRQRSTDRS